MSDEEEKGFVIKDRRLFPAEGEAVKPPEGKRGKRLVLCQR